ncbi:MAG: hypothetical protein JWP97_5955 [Labilithrix sp.]|nr:hypothetical protein [Labilithrix sp.]
MLVGRGKMEIGDVVYAATQAFERSFRVYLEVHHGTIWDTRFVRAIAREGGGRPVVYVLLEGWLAWHAHPLGALHAPCVFVASQDVVDGMGGPPFALTAGGNPCGTVQLRLMEGPDLADGSPRLVTDARPIIEAARAIASATEDDLRGPVAALLVACANAGVAPPGLAQGITRQESRNLTRIWTALRARHLLVEGFPALEGVADAAGLSMRHVARALEEIISAFNLEWRGWRDVINDMRLRWAVMLLSSSSVPINEVARSAGYGSATALGTALRKAGLPGPRDVRALIMERESERLARAGQRQL